MYTPRHRGKLPFQSPHSNESVYSNEVYNNPSQVYCSKSLGLVEFGFLILIVVNVQL